VPKGLDATLSAKSWKAQETPTNVETSSAEARLAPETKKEQWERIEKDTRDAYDPRDTVLVVPELKLVFCFIPKNGCTQFNLLMNALNGIPKLGEICTDSDPNYWSTWQHMLRTTDSAVLAAKLKDPTWTKAVFLRDPLERLVSGYRSKCEPPQECGTCMNFPDVDNASWPSFDQFVEQLDHGSNIHFDSQSSFCGGLSKTIHSYDYVGLISTDYHSVGQQVKEMLTLAHQRSHNESTSAVVNLDALEVASTPRGTTARQKKHRDKLSLQDMHKLRKRYFFDLGPNVGNDHTHETQHVKQYFKLNSTYQRALNHYAEDYVLLRGRATA